MHNYKISEKMLAKLIGYLRDKPFREVAAIIADLGELEEIKEEKKTKI